MVKFPNRMLLSLSLSLPLGLAVTGGAAFADEARFQGAAPSITAPEHREWAWDGAKDLSVDIPAVVHYRSDGPARIVINGPERFLSHVRVGGGRITTDGQAPGFGNKTLDVTVSGVTIENFALAGAGELKLGHLNQDSLKLSLSGSGSVSGDGRVDSVDVRLAGSGNAALGALRVKTASVQVSGSGDATVAPSDVLHASVAGAGTVHAQILPASVDSHVAGSGHVLVADKNGHYAEVAPAAAQQRS